MISDVTLIILFSVASGVALVARRLGVPYTVALVAAGLALGSAHVIEAPLLTRELLYAVFLPGLVFEAAFHIEYASFRRNTLVIGALAVPGLGVAMLLTAAILAPAAGVFHEAEGFGFLHALVFASLIAATDPIAVVSIFRALGAPRRLGILVEGESLLNDGTAIVVFSLVMEAVGGAHMSIAAGVVQFFAVVGAGALVGLAVGYAVSKVIQQVDDPMIEITLTTIAAYGSFALAEQFHTSGVIATVAAGMLCGNYGARTGMSPATRISVETFWEYVAFALNSLVFLLVGFEVHVEALLGAWKMIALAWAAMTLARGAMIALVGLVLSRTQERFPWTWNAVMVWGGLRGALSIVLVLGLPQEFPYRDLVVTMTFGVVLLSIVFQGLTMKPLLRRLGLTGVPAARVGYEIERGRLLGARAARQAIEREKRAGAWNADVAADVDAEYLAREREAEEAIRTLQGAEADLRSSEAREVRRHLLLVQKDRLLEAVRAGMIGREAHEHLSHQLDQALGALDLEEA